MNVLFVTDTNVPHLGGKSSHIVDLKEGLIQTGNRAEVISASSVGSVGLLTSKIKKVFLLPLKKRDAYAYSRKSIEITDNEIQKLVKKYIKENKVDVISAQDPISAIKAYEIVGEKIPVVLTMHSYFGKGMSDITGNKTAQKHFDIILERDIKSLKMIKALVAVDTRIKIDSLQYVEKYNPGLRVCSIPNFVNTDIYKPASPDEKESARKRLNIEPGKKVIICIRRLCDKNGVIYAVKAMKDVENAVLLVGGDGPDYSDIKKYIDENNLSSKVRLLGGVDGDLKKAVYTAADFAAVPSITVNGLQEATSISAIEAMACGLVLIASNIGGLAELVKNGDNGILTDEKEPGQIAESINRLCKDSQFAEKLSVNARQSVIDNYSHIAGAGKYLEVFKSAEDADR